MACPFFLPLEKLERAAWPPTARLPLGQPYQGACTANPSAPATPDEHTLRELCSFGYARGRCPRFPADAPADAVRFSAFAAADGGWRVVWILERDHAPVGHGEIPRARSRGADVVERQARVFLRSVGDGRA